MSLPSSPLAPEPRQTLRQRREAAWKKLRNRLIAGTVAVGGLFVAENKLDVSGHVSRALEDRPAMLKTYIREFSDAGFVAQKMQENNAYFQKKWITDQAQRNALTETLTNLDILVRGFSEGTVLENDILAYVLSSDERIATAPGTFLQRTVTRDGKVVETAGESMYFLLNTSTSFWPTVTEDSNNPAKQHRHLTITHDTEWWKYIFTFTDKDGHSYVVEVGVRLNRNF